MPIGGYNHPVETIEDVEEFYAAINRAHLTKHLSKEHPYTYWSLELYDAENGIRGGGGLGILAADTRRIAKQNNVPFVLITPFYPKEQHQTCIKDPASNSFQVQNTTINVDYKKYGFNYIDTVNIKCNELITNLEVISKIIGSTRIICITEKGFGELYSGESHSDHRLYQEVALGFGGYQALKLLGLKPAIMQLNEVATFFAALARLDELCSSGMDFYEAVVYTRKHTLYTNHTLVQAAEAKFSYEQFERFVFPNLKSMAVKKWLSDKFQDGTIKLSTATIEIAELKSGVSKLHARVANYRDLSGAKVKFKAITNGIDISKWTNPEILNYYRKIGVLDKFMLPTHNYQEGIDQITASSIHKLKKIAKKNLIAALKTQKNQYGEEIVIPADANIIQFKRRFVDYKRPWLAFSRIDQLKRLLLENNAYYLLCGRVHEGDQPMLQKLNQILLLIDQDPILKEHVHYIPDYNETLGRIISEGADISINNPIVGLEACGTSWMKDIINLNILISTHDGGVADCSPDSYLSISGDSESEEISSLYQNLETALDYLKNDFDLEYIIKKQLENYLPIISGSRMLRDYLDYLFQF